jgi:hypothetical protein
MGHEISKLLKAISINFMGT